MMAELAHHNWLTQHWLEIAAREFCGEADFRRAQLALFLKRGFPTRHEESWKYTDMSALTQASFMPREAPAHTLCAAIQALLTSHVLPAIRLVFIDGVFYADFSDTTQLPLEVTYCALTELPATQLTRVSQQVFQQHDATRYPFALLNAALFSNGFFLHIPAHCKLSVPLHVQFFTTQAQPVFCALRNSIHMDAHAAADILIEHISIGHTVQNTTNDFTSIILADHAQLNHIRLQALAPTASQIANVFVEQGEHSQFNSQFFACGGKLAREDVVINQAARDAVCQLSGLSLTMHDGQHFDHHVTVEHAAAHGTSSMRYKTILDNKSSAVFNGRVHVHPRAQKINASQASHNILLSPSADIYTKPELEIYADDVKCNHGATVGQLDNDALFYLQARGIPADQAKMLLLTAFVEEIFASVREATLAEYVRVAMGYTHAS